MLALKILELKALSPNPQGLRLRVGARNDGNIGRDAKHLTAPRGAPRRRPRRAVLRAARAGQSHNPIIT